MSLLTLADATVLLQACMGAFGEDIYIVSVDCLFNIRDLTVGEGPIVVGLAHGDLSVTEVKEALVAELTDPDDIIAREHARRPVRKVGVFSEAGALADGRIIRRKILFSIGDAHTLNFFAFNRSGAALTTGASISLDATIFGRWQR